MTAPLRRWLTLTLALVAAATMFVAPPGPAGAEPDDPPAADEDGGPPLLRDVLESTGRRYLEAKAALNKSKKRQLQLSLELQKAQAQLDELRPQIGRVAAESYRTGKLTAVAVLLDSDSPNSFLQRAVALNEMNLVNDQKLHGLNAAVAKVASAKKALDLEVKEEQRHLTVMNKQKRDAEKALALVGGRSLTGGFVSAKSPVAKAAPRTSDGGWPRESCSIDDPTTGGCITPRTHHMYKEARKAGFKRFVGCFRPGDQFEHPKGRACDFSLQSRGFAVAHNNDMRLYGNNLAAFLVRNADRLGILYVIWYEQIWFPATGWGAYSGGSPHTDHVHVSML